LNILKRAVTLLGLLAVTFTLTARPAAAQLYAASGSGGISGTLYILDPTTGGVLTTVGPLLTATGSPVGLTGLAFDPVSGILYGSTANASPNLSAHLVTVDPATALVTDIGDYYGGGGGSTMSDITFDPTTGILYGWQAASGHHLATIDTTTGLATLIGPGMPDFGGGGLAADSAGTLFSTPDGVTNPTPTLRTVDKVTGLTTVVGPLGFGPVNALAFDSADVLYGILGGGPGARNLVTIDTITGTGTIVGPTVDNLDALAFRPTAAIPEPGALALLVGSGLSGSLFVLRRRRR
jgi:hypothetical protein